MSERRGSVQAGGSSSTTAKKSNKRATLSCSECRRLKLRCDRQVPCSSCVKRGLSHLCPDGALAPTRTSKLAASATALAERVELLEELLQQNGLGHTVPPMPEAANLGLDMMAKRRDQTAAAREGGNGGAGAGARKGEGSGSGVRVMKTEEVEVEMLQMGVGSLTLRDDGSYRYLGPSAGMAFRGESTHETAGTVFAPQSPTDDPTRPSPSVESLDLPSSFPFLAVQTTIEDIQDALPPKEEAVRVSKLYWDNCTFMFSPIAYNDYWDDYLESAYSAEPHAAKVACVCMVLALGVQFDPDLPPTATTVFERYFDLGQAALAVSRFLSHLAVIQALHLTGNVLLNRPKWRESGENFFPLFAVAIKGAQVMGLHRDPSAWGLDEAEVHRRRLAFWEVLSLDRLQAFMSGRPYTIHAAHFDTLMPEDVDESTKEKYRIVQFLAEAIDGLWSVKIPSYSAITAMDQQLRRQYTSSPEAARCRALPPSAFLAPGTIPPAPPAQDDAESASSRVQCEQHTWGMLYAVILFYMHKGPFAQALERYSEEPLQSPWAPSVRVIVLEATAYILKIARSWMSLDPVLSPRWWHISLHLFVAGVSMSSFIVRSPTSLLASHAWDQLNEACSIFESAALSGTAPAVTLPRILALRQKAYDAITASRKLPSEPADPVTIKEDPDGAAADLLSLGTTTLLSRGGKSTAAGHTGDNGNGQASSSATAAGPPPPHQPDQGLPPYPSMAAPEAGGQPSFAGPASYLHLLTAAHNRDAPSSEQFALAPPPANPVYEPYTQHLPYPPPPSSAAANSNAFPQYGQQPPPPPPPDQSFFPPYPPGHPAAGYHLAHLLPSYPPPPGGYMPGPPARYGDFAAPLPVPSEMGHRGSTSGPSGGWGGGDPAGANGAGEGREGGQGAGSSAAQDWEWWQEMAAAKPPQG